MIVVDVNLLIYAVNEDAPFHRKAKSWLETALSGTETVGLAWMVLLAFLRLTTRA
jgi:predicted nucleic acid-binding protein